MGRPASGKWRAEPRSEPDSGHPTVRDRRGALGDVTHGEPRNPTRKSKERLWSLLAYRCARPGSIPTTRMSGSVGGWGQQRPWSTRPRGSVGVRSPLSSGTARCICGGYGRKVTRLTLGDLRACLVLGGCREGVRWARRSQQRAEGSSQRPEARTSEPGPMPWSRVPTEAQSWELRRPEVAMSRDSCVKRHRRARTRSDHRPRRCWRRCCGERTCEQGVCAAETVRQL